MNSWKLNATIAIITLASVCATVVVVIMFVQYSADRRDVQPRDVLAELKVQGEHIAHVTRELADLRFTVNHAKELAADNAEIVAGLNSEITELKKELMKFNVNK